MSGFTKLVPEIVQSSIWNQPSDIRVVWITMLAIKDENGFVRGNAETLSRMANVTLQSVTDALEVFTSPDADSCTPDDDGRRIEKYQGGWLVLNHEKYRTKEAEIKEQTRERVRKYRERHKEKDNVTDGNVTPALPSASASASDSASKDGGCKGELGKPKKEQKQKRDRGKLNAHGEFERVMISDIEYQKLCKKHGKAKADAGIQVLDAWIERTGTKRENHYACMDASSFVWEKVTGQKLIQKPQQDFGPTFNDY